MINVVVSNTHSKIFYQDSSKEEAEFFKALLIEKFTAHDTSLDRTFLVQRGLESPYRCLYNTELDIIQTGLVPFTKIYAKQNNIPVRIFDKRKYPAFDLDYINELKEKNTYRIGTFDLRDYQAEAILSAYKYKAGIIESGTGSGKTLILAGLLRLAKNCKVICVFDRIGLIYQTKEALENQFGFNKNEIGVVGDGINEFDRRMVLLSMMSYQNMFTEFPDVGFVIMDEVHTTGRTEVAEKILFSCQNAPMRIGLSATASVLENPYQQLKLYANVGPIIMRRDMRTQMDDGVLAETTVKLYTIKNEPEVPIMNSWSDIYEKRECFKEDLVHYEKDTKHKWIIETTTKKVCFLEKQTAEGKKTTKRIESERLDEFVEQGWTLVKTKLIYIVKRLIDYGDESLLTVRNETRNKAIVQLAKKLDRVLILFSKITHGEILQKMLPDAILIHGSHDMKDRKAAKQKLADDPKCIIIASSIFDIGEDIPAVKNLILASVNVGKVRVIQKGGRAVRVDKKTNKTTATIHDIYSMANKIALRQSEKREKIYKENMKLKIEKVEIEVT